MVFGLKWIRHFEKYCIFSKSLTLYQLEVKFQKIYKLQERAVDRPTQGVVVDVSFYL